MTASYEEELLKELKKPEEALAYLKISFEDEDPSIFLTALGRVAKANGGLSTLAKRPSPPEVFVQSQAGRDNPACRRHSIYRLKRLSSEPDRLQCAVTLREQQVPDV